MTILLALTLACSQKLDALFADKAYSGIAFSAVVMDREGRVLYEHGADTRLVPASNAKVLSSVYAFSVLGKDWRPKTRFWKEGDDVVVDAVGDPGLTSTQLNGVVAKLQLKAPFKVKVHAAFKGGYPDGWKADDYQFKYGRPVFAFSVDQALLPVYAQKGALEPLPESVGVIVRRGRLKGPVESSYDFWARVLTVRGSLPTERKVVAEITAPDPTAHACYVMGGVPAGPADLPAREPDAVIEGKPLSELAAECLKPSDNMMAESILQLAVQEDLKRTGKSLFDPDPAAHSPFTWAGANMQDFYWSRLGVRRQDIRMFDGSGLSRQNLVTGRTLARALQFAWGQEFRGAFVSALPRPGEAGTLRNRLKGQPVAAKTGSLNNVAALSGYVFPDSQDPLIFAVIGNTNGRPASLVRTLADKLVTQLAGERSTDGTQRGVGSLRSVVPDAHARLALGHRVR